ILGLLVVSYSLAPGETGDTHPIKGFKCVILSSGTCKGVGNALCSAWGAAGKPCDGSQTCSYCASNTGISTTSICVPWTDEACTITDPADGVNWVVRKNTQEVAPCFRIGVRAGTCMLMAIAAWLWCIRASEPGRLRHVKLAAVVNNQSAYEC